MKQLALVAFCGLCLWNVYPAYAGGEIYGTIYTDRGEEFTGPIRWDRNENFWDDVLDSDKRDRVFVEGDRGTFRIFGLSFGTDGGHWSSSQFKIFFGNIEAIEPRRGDRVRIEIKGDQRIDVDDDGADLGGMRELVIWDEAAGEVELDWDEVERVEFRQGPGRGLDDERLYGTVETRGGDFTGYIVWDKDESLKDDILDGKDDGRKHKIPFGKIKSIERKGSRASNVELIDGSRLRLAGTNDVDDDNRGIDITVPGVGLIKVEWEDFDRVVFADAPASRRFDDFDGGRRLYGVVKDDHGRSYTGFIIWDLDEAHTWEFLDGEDEDIQYEIPFENIATIAHHSRRSAEVTLHNGDVLILSGSNDVDRDNKGIVIEMDDGDEVELDWYDFDIVEFKKK